MPFIPMERVNLYFEIQKEIKQAGCEALVTYGAIFDKDIRVASLDPEIDQEGCHFDDKWGESFITIPLEILYSHSAMDKARTAKLEQDKRKELEEADNARADEIYERRLYDRLKAKYEPNKD